MSGLLKQSQQKESSLTYMVNDLSKKKDEMVIRYQKSLQNFESRKSKEGDGKMGSRSGSMAAVTDASADNDALKSQVKELWQEAARLSDELARVHAEKEQLTQELMN